MGVCRGTRRFEAWENTQTSGNVSNIWQGYWKKTVLSIKEVV